MSDSDFFNAPDTESNSVAQIVKHVAGNLRSRWLDFLTTDGEKPDRNRDQEFVLTQADTRARPDAPLGRELQDCVRQHRGTQARGLCEER